MARVVACTLLVVTIGTRGSLWLECVGATGAVSCTMIRFVARIVGGGATKVSGGTEVALGIAAFR